MDPYNEQRLRDEVIYLHSLWRQGPPNPVTATTTTKRTRFLQSLGTSQTPSFGDKKSKRKRKRKRRMTVMTKSDSGAPWPCPAPTKVQSQSGWPETRPVYPPATAKEAETHSALKLQHRASNVFREFFVKSGDDDDDDDDDEEDEEDYWADLGEEKLQFFLRIFTEDSELRTYFEENHEGGEFCCFVCGGLGKKNSGKRFKSCLGLVQHSAAMSKTERNQSHRAFAQVVCRVLGWDFDRLPTVVTKGEPLSRTLGSAGKRQVDSVGDGVVVRDNVVAVNDNGGESVEKEAFDDLQTDDRKGESVGDIVRDNGVAVDDNNGAELVEKEGFDNLQFDDGKGHLKCEGAESVIDKGISKVEGNENETVDGMCSKGEDKHNDEDEEEDPSEDGDEHGNEDEEEDPSEHEDEEEDPSEDKEEEEDPSECKDEEEDPSEDEDEEEDPLEDGNEHESKYENKGASEDSTVLKSGALGQPSAKLGDSQVSNQPPVSSSGWPCTEAAEKSPSAILEWPTITPHLASVASLLSDEEQAKLAADQLQYKAVRVCQEFFRTNSGLDGDEYDSEDDEEEDPSEDSDSEDEDAGASKDSKLFDFFSKLFVEDVELRDFYVKNNGSGDFCCLVCGGIGKKVWKRFTGCIALVQHSTAISRTKKKLAHRAYGLVICQVLGWDMNRFPSIALRGESPGQP